MNRIEEIKQVVKHSPQDFEVVVPAFKSQIFLEYLLAKLEIATQALEVYADDSQYCSRCDGVTYDKENGLVAIEALKAIRE